jgi:hypothetical protein
MNEVSNGISIQNMCYQCQALETLCPDCLELKDSRDIYIAHQIVDEGNLQYQHIWSRSDLPVSGHDWVGSITRTYRGTERQEFLEPVTNLSDRFMDLETSMTVLDSEVICQSCHLLYNKHQADCPVCF